MVRTSNPKPIRLLSSDRQMQDLLRAAHDQGRHGDGTKPDVLAYWAIVCPDCNLTHNTNLVRGRS